MTDIHSPIPVAALLRLLALTRQLALPNDMTSLLRMIIDAGRDIVGAERGAVLLYDAERRVLHPGAERGSLARYLAPSAGHRSAGPCADTAVAEVAATRRVVSGSTTVSVPLLAGDSELVGVLQLSDPVQGSFTAADTNIVEVLAGHAAAAIQQERARDEHVLRMKMERALDAARLIQERVLPRSLPAPEGYSVAAFSRPAEQTGGDLYDIVPIGPTDASPIALLLADASGHGIAPALSVVQVRAMLRLGLRLDASLPDLIRKIDAQLGEDLADDQFVTAFIGCLDPLRHQLVYHAAGQGPLLHYHAVTGRAEWRGASALPLGVGDAASHRCLPVMNLERGDAVALLTDGFYECESCEGHRFGEDRVAALVAAHREEGARAVLGALVGALDGFAAEGPQADDLTAIIVCRDEWEAVQ